MEINQQHITNLIERCKKQDNAAQMEVYNRYFKAMYNISFRILNDEFEAEDIMQEGFITAFEKLASFKGDVAFGAWLKRIVINKSLTQLKKNKKYNDTKLAIVHQQETVTEEIDYETLKASSVVTYLHQLKESYKTVLVLNLIEGYDYEEISQIMEMTNENVRTTISRAKKKLKQLLLAKPTKKAI